METPSVSSRDQKLTLVLIGIVVGACWGLLYHLLLVWVQCAACSWTDMRAFTWIFVGATVGMCLACVWLSRWYTLQDGGVLWIPNTLALITAADVLWYCGNLHFVAMPHTEMWCLTIALATFVFAASFFARPKDKLFH